MNETLLKQYQELDDQIKSLETTKKEIGLKIISALNELQMKTAKTSFGTFSIVEKTTIKPSDEGQLKINELKYELKQEENEIIKMDIERGTAREEKSEYLRFQKEK